MFTFLKAKSASAPERERSSVLIRRLFADYGRRHIRLIILIIVMMAVASLCLAVAAKLAGQMIDSAYVRREFEPIVTMSIEVFAIFCLKGLTSYGQAVTLSYLTNRITAENQRLMFDKLLG